MLNEIFKLDKLFDVFNYIFCFFALNVLFWGMNIPLIIFFMFVGISGTLTYFPLFLFCLIPTMPAFTIILYCMNKLYRTKNVDIIKDFVKGFKLNFKQSLIIWSTELVIVFLIYSNIRFFTIATSNFLILNCMFIGMLIMISIVTPYVFLIISRFSMKGLQIIRLSFILTFTRPVLTITNLLLIIFFLIVFEINPALTILFISTTLAFSQIFINKALLNELEDISKKNN